MVKSARARELAADHMRSIIVIAILVLVVAGLAPRYLDKAAAPVATGTSAAPMAPVARVAVEAPPTRSISAGPRSVVIPPDRRGHFQVDGTIDGRRVGFMVDTGASTVALRQRDAARLSIHPAQRDYRVQVSTANGIVRAAAVTLDRIEIGGVTVRGVAALVIPDEALGENLLGLSFLSRLRRFEYREGRMILEE
jgi:aspartyl protease family protein